MKFIIYKTKKSPTQSGSAKEKYWILENIRDDIYEKDILTGWAGSLNNQNIKLKFMSKKEAIDYANKNQYEYNLIEESTKKFKLKNYADNFKFKRIRTDI